MTDLRKAAEQALEAGETTIRLLRAEAKYPALVVELDGVFDTLRAALAEADDVANITLRDHFAGQALAGMLADSDRGGNFEDYARDAARFADALIAELDKTRESKP